MEWRGSPLGEQKCFERGRHVLWIVGIENRYSKIRWGWLGWLKNTHERQRMGEEEKRKAVFTQNGWVWRGVVKLESEKHHGVEREFLGEIKIFRMSSACFVDCGIRKEVFGEVNGVLLVVKNLDSCKPMGEEEKKIQVEIGLWVGVERCCENQEGHVPWSRREVSGEIKIVPYTVAWFCGLKKCDSKLCMGWFLLWLKKNQCHSKNGKREGRIKGTRLSGYVWV